MLVIMFCSTKLSSYDLQNLASKSRNISHLQLVTLVILLPFLSASLSKMSLYPLGPLGLVLPPLLCLPVLVKVKLPSPLL